MAKPIDFATNVFVNCPFDENYRPLLRAMVFSVFNMPFELGLDLGAREYGSGYLKEKQLLILDKERYRFQRFLSDIAGQDIAAHNQSPAVLVEKVRSWLNTMRASGPPLLGATRITSLLALPQNARFRLRESHRRRVPCRALRRHLHYNAAYLPQLLCNTGGAP